MTEGLTSGQDQFLVHSYHIVPQIPHYDSFTRYGGQFVSGIRSGNCYATQFHPEKSKRFASIPKFFETPGLAGANLRAQRPLSWKIVSGTIRLGSENFEFPIIEGTEGEKALDTRTLRCCITFDEGYGNTGSWSVTSRSLTVVGILRHRLCHRRTRGHSSFETAMLVIYGSLPQKSCLNAFARKFARVLRSTGMHSHFDGFHKRHPMAVLHLCSPTRCLLSQYVVQQSRARLSIF